MAHSRAHVFSAGCIMGRSMVYHEQAHGSTHIGHSWLSGNFLGRVGGRADTWFDGRVSGCGRVAILLPVICFVSPLVLQRTSVLYRCSHVQNTSSSSSSCFSFSRPSPTSSSVSVSSHSCTPPWSNSPCCSYGNGASEYSLPICLARSPMGTTPVLHLLAKPRIYSIFLCPPRANSKDSWTRKRK